MKKFLSSIMFLAMYLIVFLSGMSYASENVNISAQLSNENIKPGEEVTVNVNFDKPLTEYVLNVGYDNNIFEYVSVDEGTASDETNNVVINYSKEEKSTGKSSTNLIFKAKSEITTINPTEFVITAKNLKGIDSVEYLDVTTPVNKIVTVSPEYVDYSLNLKYEGNILAGVEKDMIIDFSSSMGKYYAKAKLIAKVTKPDDATVSIIGIDEYQAKHDLVESGWGDPQGFAIGGKDISQTFNVKGLFSKAGDYKVTLQLLNREDGDTIISEKTFDVSVVESELNAEQTENPVDGVGAINNQQTEGETKTNTNTDLITTQPNKLPKTGYNIYIPIVIALLSTVGMFVYYNKK